MSGKTPETCWAVNKRQDNKLENCCMWLVVYLNCTMMHGITNLKFKSVKLIFLSDSPRRFKDITLNSEINSQDLKLKMFTAVLQMIAGNLAITHWINFCVNKVVFACYC
jgi:hypothetical protein